MKPEHDRDISRLASLRGSKDLAAFIRLADELEQKWSKMNETYYPDLMLNICNLLRSVDFGAYARQNSFIQKYANLALDKSSEIPLETELQLLLHLQDDIPSPRELMNGRDWLNQRSRRAKMWFHAWHRLEQEIDQDFDFEDLPLRNVAPPEGAYSRPGVVPEHIKDLQLRAEYEGAITENVQKAKIYSKQYILRHLYRLFSPKAEQYIIEAYSRPPFDLEELSRCLEMYIDDEESKNRILDAVKDKMPNP